MMMNRVAILAFACVLFLAVGPADFAEVPKSCKPGQWGSPCKKCECGDRADTCDFTTGKCFCNTKGVIGDKCELCDDKKRYKGDALKDGCFLDIDEAIKYNFKFSSPQNANYTKVNFKLSPENRNDNVHLKINCIEICGPFELKITAKEGTKEKKVVVEHQKLNDKAAFEKVLLAKEYKFGLEKEKALTEIQIHMYNFKTPIVFEISAVPESKLKDKTLMTMNES